MPRRRSGSSAGARIECMVCEQQRMRYVGGVRSVSRHVVSDSDAIQICARPQQHCLANRAKLANLIAARDSVVELRGKCLHVITRAKYPDGVDAIIPLGPQAHSGRDASRGQSEECEHCQGCHHEESCGELRQALWSPSSVVCA